MQKYKSVSVNIVLVNFKVLCSDQLGLACIVKGYWYGPVTSNISDTNNNDTKNYIEKCPYCKYSTRHICPSQISSSSSEFVLLSQTLDDQCGMDVVEFYV